MPREPRKPRAPRKSRANPDSTKPPNVQFKDKAILLDGGSYQCRRRGVVTDTPKSLEEHWTKQHKETFPCLLCRINSKTMRDTRTHHFTVHQEYSEDGRDLCGDCNAARTSSGLSLSHHMKSCPRPKGKIQDGWFWDEEKKQAFRIETQPGQNFQLSLDLCRDNMPRHGMKIPPIPPPKASASPRLAQQLTPRSVEDNISAGGQQETPVSQVTLPQVNIYGRPSTPPPLSPGQIHSLQTFNAAAQSSHQENCPNPKNLDTFPVDRSPSSHRLDYEKWFDSLVQIPDNAVSASPPSHSLSKPSLRLTSRQASRYPDVSTLSSSLAKVSL